MAPQRVVIDPNVWISAVISPSGAPGQVVDLVEDGKLVPIVTPHLLDELITVLLRPRFRRWISVADALALVDTIGRSAVVQSDVHTARQAVRDPDDTYLVALAKQTGALVVSGDADLLEADLDPPAISPTELLTGMA